MDLRSFKVGTLLASGSGSMCVCVCVVWYVLRSHQVVIDMAKIKTDLLWLWRRNLDMPGNSKNLRGAHSCKTTQNVADYVDIINDIVIRLGN